MDLGTLIALLIGLAAIIIPIAVKVITIGKHSKEGKVIRTLEWLIVILIVIAVLLICFYFYNSRKENKENYNSLIAQGEFAETNNQYIEAAGLFGKAQQYAFDASSEAYALQSQGTCYMLNGIYNKDEQYFTKALHIFKTVLDTERYENTAGYLAAMIDICSVYNFLNYDYADEDWAEAINKLESMVSFNDLQNKSADALSYIISAGLNICNYYCGIRESSPSALLYGQEDGGKALYYLTLTMDAERYYNEQVGESVYNPLYFYLIYNITNYLMIDVTFNTDENYSQDQILEVLEDARIICQEAVSELNVQTEYQLIDYIRLERNIGKSYLFSSYFANKQTNLKNAHDELMGLFDIKSEEAKYELLTAASFALMTKLCTDEEIGHILDECEIYIERLRSESNVPMLITAEYEVLTICENILMQDTAEKARANEIGNQYCVEIRRQYENLLTDQQKQELANFERKLTK